MGNPRTAVRYTEEDCLLGRVPAEHYEIWDGQLCVHDSSGGWAGEVASRIAGRIRRIVDEKKNGWVPSAEQGYVVQRNPDRILEPDAAFVSKARLPALPQRRMIPMAPDFVVEVRSPYDSWSRVVAKCGIWLAHGSLVAWAVDPKQRLVVVLRGDDDVQDATGADVISAAPALPELSITVDALFEGLDPAGPE